MENSNPIPVTQVPVKKKKGKLLLLIGIPLLVIAIVVGIFIYRGSLYKQALELIEDGDLEEAIEIHEKLGNYKDLEEELSDGIVDKFRSQLKKDNYKRAASAYALGEDYPDARSGMHKQLRKKINEELGDYDYDHVLELYGYLDKYEAAVEAMDQAIGEFIETTDYYTLLDLHDRFAAEMDLSMAAIEERLVEYAIENMEAYTYYSMFECYARLDDAALRQQVDEKIVEHARALLEYNYYWFSDLWWYLEGRDLVLDGVLAALYEYAETQVENESYDMAYECFQRLAAYDYQDSEARCEEVKFMETCWLMTYYLECGWYSDARYLMEDYSGEQYDQLYAIYVSYCADATFLADLMTGLLERKAALEAGFSLEEAIEIEWSYLEQYYSLYLTFADESLREIAMEYVDALEQQRYAIKYYSDDSYEQYYQSSIGAYRRYKALGQLHDQYGFGQGDVWIEDLIRDAADGLTYYTAAYEIHNMLADYLWGIAGYWDGEKYVLRVYNYTEYTFSIQVFEEFYLWNSDLWDYEMIHDCEAHYSKIRPGDYLYVVVEYPEDNDYWYIDWYIYDIYDGDNNKIPNF